MFIPYFILISICLLRKNQASDPYLEINLPDTEIQQFVDDLWNEEKDQWPSLRVNFQRHTTASNQRDEAPERWMQLLGVIKLKIYFLPNKNIYYIIISGGVEINIFMHH